MKPDLQTQITKLEKIVADQGADIASLEAQVTVLNQMAPTPDTYKVLRVTNDYVFAFREEFQIMADAFEFARTREAKFTGETFQVAGIWHYPEKEESAKPEWVKSKVMK